MLKYLLSFILLSCSLLLTAEETDPEATQPTGASAEQALKVFQVFSEKCVDCHGGHRKAKGGFGFVLDLKRLGNDDYYVTKGDAADSELYSVLVTEDESYLMPPPDSDTPAMTAEEIQAVADWINAGAGIGHVVTPSEEGAEIAETTDDVAVTAEADDGKTLSTSVGHLHPLVVHFPIALIFVVALAEALFLYCKCNEMLFAGRLCLWISFLSSIPSVVTGWINAGVEGYSDESVFTHRWGGVAVIVVCAILIALDHLRKKSESVGIVWTYRVLLFLTLFLVALVGHTGGELVYGEDYF